MRYVNHRALCWIVPVFLLIPCIASAKSGDYAYISSSRSLMFIENKGQVTDQHRNLRKDIDCKFRSSGVTAFIGDGAIHYQWVKRSAMPVADTAGIIEEEQAASVIYRLDVTLVGADKNAMVTFEKPTAYYERYYLPQTPDGIKVQGYRKVIYKNVYPGIDWVLYTSEKGLKYDFVVHPEGDVRDIQLQYDGSTDLAISDGALIATTPLGRIEESKPLTYDGETGKEIASEYELEGNRLSYKVEAGYKNIVIDPGLVFSTYFGGSEDEESGGVVADKNGRIYVCGSTFSSNIATKGTFQVTFGDTSDAYVARFDTTGKLKWSTYFGGNRRESFSSVDIGVDGYVYAGGYSQSSGLATKGVHQEVKLGSHAMALLAKLDSAGQRVWATYYGGTQGDDIQGVSCDKYGYTYIAGSTYSISGISTPKAFQVSRSIGGIDGFLAKFDSTGNIVWGTYYGGRNASWIFSVDVSEGTEVSVCGQTFSDTNIATSNAHQPKLRGTNDGFLALFDSSGARIWSTYLGGVGYNGPSNARDGLTGTAFDRHGNIYTVGFSYEDTGITTQGSFKPKHTGLVNGVIAKFDKTGVLKWSTFYGTDQVWLNSVYVDTIGGVYILGQTRDNAGISTPGILSDTLTGMSDMMIVKFDEDGNRKWGTYFGGSGNDNVISFTRGTSISVYNNVLYITSETYSTDIPVTNGVHQTYNAGKKDAFLIAIRLDTNVVLPEPFPDSVVCPGDYLTVPYTTTLSFRPGNQFTVQLSDSSSSFSNPVTIGSTTSNTPGVIYSQVPSNILPGVNYKLRIIATAPIDTYIFRYTTLTVNPIPTVTATANAPICEGKTLILKGDALPIGNTHYFWSKGAATSATKDWVKPSIQLADSGDYLLAATVDGCVGYDTINIEVNPIPQVPEITTNSPLCDMDTLHLMAVDTTTGAAYEWTGPNGFRSYSRDTVIPVAGRSQYTGVYTVKATHKGCTSAVYRDTVVILSVPYPQIAELPPVCEGSSLSIVCNDTIAASYSWASPNGNNQSGNNLIIATATLADNGVYIVTADNKGCIGYDTVVAEIVSLPGRILITGDTVVCEGDTFRLAATDTSTGVSYTWNGPGNYYSTGKTLTVGSATEKHAGEYTVIADRKGCIVDTFVSVRVKQRPNAPVATSNSAVELGTDLKLVFTNPTPGASIIWEGPNGFRSYAPQPVIPNVTYPYAGTYTLYTELEGCASSAVTIVIVYEAVDTGKLVLYPNPNKGVFILKGYVADNTPIECNVISAMGRVVFNGQLIPRSNQVDEHFQLDGLLPSGVYYLRLVLRGRIRVIPFTIAR